MLQVLCHFKDKGIGDVIRYYNLASIMLLENKKKEGIVMTFAIQGLSADGEVIEFLACWC